MKEDLSKALENYRARTKDVKKDLSILKERLDEVESHLNQKIRELNISSAYLGSILANMSQGLLFVNAEGIVTTFNPAAERLLDRPAIEVLYAPFSDSFPDKLFGWSLQECLQKRHSPPPTKIRIKRQEKRSRYIEVEAKAIEHLQEPGASHLDPSLDFARGLIILLRDITVERRLRRAAEHDRQLTELGQMAAMVAHEIRNPLGGIKGYASLLRRDLENDPTHKKYADQIIEGTNTLNTFLTNVLDHARPWHPTLEKTDLVALVKETVDSLQVDQTFPDNIALSWKAGLQTLPCLVDGPMLRRVLLNLCWNAAEAMPEGGELSLEIRLAPDKESLDLLVRDSGAGIEKNNLEKIFTPLFSTKPQGNGFGLSEARKAVAAHKGQIEVESEVGRGTTFTITLPLDLSSPATL